MIKTRETPIEMGGDDFKKIGHQLIDRIADFFDTIRERPVTTGETPAQLQTVLGNSPLPENGMSPEELVLKSAELLFDHSLLNGHPKFLGYITSSAAPVGALADMIAAAVNPNVGANILSPIATEIEKQTVRWLAEFIGVSSNYGGILVSGGNMANFTAFLAAKAIYTKRHSKEDNIAGALNLTAYCSRATHTWIEKAASLFGTGARSVRWIPTDANNRMSIEALKQTIQNDMNNDCTPFMVIGNAGDVSTGAVDDLEAIASVCKAHGIWFHIDGAYGIPAAIVPELNSIFNGIEQADSIALDPHKWLYSPLEAGCTLVKNPNHLIETYSSHPVYYNFSQPYEGLTQNYYEYGLQNSRGFRALKVWMALQQVGRSGYIKMISQDIQLSKSLFEKAKEHPELEALTQNLSIATFRYIPLEFAGDNEEKESYLNELNEALLNELQLQGEVFLSNAVVAGRYCLRACIVNFRTSENDITEIIEIVVREGKNMHRRLREKTALKNSGS